MEHIRLFDKCANERESHLFLTQEVMENSVTERILNNRFRDPMISSDEEENAHQVDWDQVFTRPVNYEIINPRTYIPGLRPLPSYPHISSLNSYQHTQLLKVVNTLYPNVLEAVHIQRPTKVDRQIYNELQEKYLAEQKEYIAWAKTQWVNGHNIRALRPKPFIETVYEAEFKVKMTEHKSLPKQYELAAQINLRTDAGSFEFVPLKDLVKVSITDIPQHTNIPDLFERKVSILKTISSPQPCQKHPCRFVLPGDNTVSMLPLTEIQRELAQYTADNGARFCASEKALRKLVEGSAWCISVAVCKVTGTNGEPCNVVVIGSDFAVFREPSQVRTYKAFRHLLYSEMVPPEEKAKLVNSWKKKPEVAKKSSSTKTAAEDLDSSDDEESQLVIDIEQPDALADKQVKRRFSRLSESSNADTIQTPQKKEKIDRLSTEREEGSQLEKQVRRSSRLSESSNAETIKSPLQTETNDRLSNASEEDSQRETKDRLSNASEEGAKQLPQLFTCSCEDTMFERPPMRSFRKWEVKSKRNHDKLHVVVHCSHKLKGKSGEVLLEPIPEYQIDLGASEVPEEKMKSLALGVHLRKNASVLFMRIDAPTGDLVAWDSVKQEEITKKHSDFIPEAANYIYTVLGNLKDLMPGNYILRHESEHGANALLYVSRAAPQLEPQLEPQLAPQLEPFRLHFDLTAATDDAKCLNTAPTLAPVLLPFHKHHRLLPCAFTPHAAQLPRDHSKPPGKLKHPPAALTYPKKKKKGKKRRA